MKSLLIILSIFASTQVLAADSFYAPLKLAIEHFNGDGTTDLQAFGPEHQYMMDALAAVEAQFPELKDASMAPFDQKQFSALQLYTFAIEGDAQYEASIENMDFYTQKVNELVDGCGYTKETVISEQNLGNTTPSTGTKTTTIYNLDGRGNMKCTNAFVASLLQAGVNSVVLAKDVSKYGSIEFKVSFEQTSNIYRDMRYVKNQIMQLKGADTTFFSLFNPPAPLQLIGVSSDITLVGSNGQGKLDEPVVLEYYQGSGDCPAGCINNVFTQVEVTPSSSGFTAKIIGTKENNF